MEGAGDEEAEEQLPPLLPPPHRRQQEQQPQAPLGPTEKQGCGVGGRSRGGPRRQPLTRRRNNHNNNLDPFAGRDLFPPLEEAFRISRDDDDDDGQHSDVSLNLSIGARAALHEHLRHVARFGIDGSFAAADDADEDTERGDEITEGTSSDPRRRQMLRGLLVDPLDEEWERLNRSTSTSHESEGNHDDGEASGTPNSSFFVRHVVLGRDSGSGSGGSLEEASSDHEGDDEEGGGGIGGEAYEVRTDLSTDYFNSSRVKLLLTPEKVRNRPGPHVTTTRGNRSYDTSSGSGSASVLSSSIVLDEGQSVFGSDLGHGGGFDDENDNREDDDGDGDHRAGHYHSLFFSDAEGGDGVDVSFSAIHDVSRISALDVSHISADGSDAGDRSLLHSLFASAAAPTATTGAAAASAPALSFAAARTPPRPALRAINDSRATIDDELAKVVLYSSPQRLAAARRIPSPRRAPEHLNHRAAFLPSSLGDGRSIRSRGDDSGRSSQGCGGNSSSSGSGNVTSEDESGFQSREDSAGYRADKEYSVSASTNDGRSAIQYAALSPTSTQASPPACRGQAFHTDLTVRDGTDRTDRFGAGSSERRKTGVASVGANDVINASSSPGRMTLGSSHVPGLLSGRLTRTLSNDENVEVVVMYDLAPNSIEHDSDISSLHNQSSSYDKTNSSTSRSDSAANDASSATSPPLVGSHPNGRAPGGTAVDAEDRRRYRTVVPSRVFLDLPASSTNDVDDAMLFPEPYDSFLSNPSSTASQQRIRKEWTVREHGSHRSAPI